MKIMWSKNALQDLENIKQYIKKDSDYYSKPVSQRELHTIDIVVTADIIYYKHVKCVILSI